MTPQQALEILDRVASMATLPRNDHAMIVQAVQVLSEMIKSQEPETVQTKGE